MQTLNFTNKYNLIGMIAILLWSTSALAILSLTILPVFELTAIVLGISGILTCIKISLDKSWHKMILDPKLIIPGILGLGGNSITYYLALRYAPPAHVELISWTWPLVMTLWLVPWRKNPQAILTSMLGFVALLVFSADKFNLTYHNTHSWLGYLFAILDVIFWSYYIIVTQKFKSAPYTMPGIYNAIAALLAMICHFMFESSLSPTTNDWFYLIYIGVGPLSIAFFCWDVGTKQGDVILLGRLAYLIPIISTVMLTIANYATMTPQLITAIIIVLTACILPNTKLMTK